MQDNLQTELVLKISLPIGTLGSYHTHLLHQYTVSGKKLTRVNLLEFTRVISRIPQALVLECQWAVS